MQKFTNNSFRGISTHKKVPDIRITVHGKNKLKQKGATKRSGAIKKNLQKFKNILFQGISTRKKVQVKEVVQIKRTCKSSRHIHSKKVQLKEVAQLKRTCKSSRTFPFEAYPLAKGSIITIEEHLAEPKASINMVMEDFYISLNFLATIN